MKIFILFLIMTTSHAFASNLITQKSQFFHDKTVSVVKKFLKKKKLKVFSVIDHHKGAKRVKLNLDKTTLIIFGNPKVGTLLMQDNQLIGLDLPLKILIHTSGNTTKISYKKIEPLKQEYKISSKLDDKFRKIEKLFSRVAEHIGQEEVKKVKKKKAKVETIKSYD
jgi:uncharacterized protein (DUF302 family)